VKNGSPLPILMGRGVDGFGPEVRPSFSAFVSV
jgi:hypothetical protein